MSLDWNKLSPEDRDARITSLLLGELPPNEAEELRAIIGTDPELARACVRRGKTISLLREAAAVQGQVETPAGSEIAASARLSKERREKLLETFKSAAPAPVERVRRRLQIPQWFLPMSAAAMFIGAMIVFAAAVLFPTKREVSFALPTGGSSPRADYYGYWFGRDMFKKDVSEDRQSSAAKMADAQADMMRRGAVDQRIDASGQVPQLTTLSGVPDSDFSDKIESKISEAARTSRRFAIALPNTENKERGREPQLARAGKTIADYDIDAFATVVQAGERPTANFEHFSDVNHSGLTVLNGQDAKASANSVVEFRTKDADGTVAGGVPMVVNSPAPQAQWHFTQGSVSGLAGGRASSEEKAKAVPPVPTNPDKMVRESELVQATTIDALKPVELKLEDRIILGGDATEQSKASANYSATLREVAPAKYAYAITGTNFVASQNGWAELPATAPISGGTMFSSGTQPFGSTVASEKNLSPAAPVPSVLAPSPILSFGRTLNNQVTRQEPPKGEIAGISDTAKQLNEGFVNGRDNFGVQLNDPIALGFKPAEPLTRANEPRPEAKLGEGIVTYSDDFTSAAKPTASPTARGLGTDGVTDLQVLAVNPSLPAVMAQDLPLGARDQELDPKSLRGDVGGAVNLATDGEKFGNRRGFVASGGGSGRGGQGGGGFNRERLYVGNGNTLPAAINSAPELNRTQRRSGASTAEGLIGRFKSQPSENALGDLAAKEETQKSLSDADVDMAVRFQKLDSVGLPILPADTVSKRDAALDALTATEPARIEAAKMVQDGKLFYESGRLKEAEEVLEKAAAIEPKNAGANYYLDLVKAQEARSGKTTATLAIPEITYNPTKPESKPIPSPKVENSPEVARLAAELENLKLLRDRVSQVYDVTALESKQAQLGLVQVIEPADASSSEKPSLLGRIGNAFGGGGVKRKAVISIEPDMPDVDPQGRIAFRPMADPSFIQTEFDRIRSTNVLKQVADKLNLNENWAKGTGKDRLSDDETIALLKKRVEVGQQANTTLVEIRGKSENPEEAARIANAVAEAYGSARHQSRANVTANGLASLKTQLAEKDKQIAQISAQLEQQRKESSVEVVSTNVPKRSTNAPVPQPEVLSRENAFSTFSLNVSDVSFKLAAASLEKGAMPDAANIRSEEFINAFDYRDPMPLPGAPLAFAWERARYPFAHNRDVVRFSVKTAAQGREAGKPLNIVVLLDNSGSMERADRVRIIQESLRTLAAQLKPQDKISVVTFARTASLRVDGVSGTNAIDVADKVGVLTPEGGTNLEEALDLAYRTALRHYEASAVNRIVLLTDGAANLGNVEPKTLKAKVENYRKQGIALDCFGIGWEGFNDDLLEQLSRNGDGRYGFVNTPEEAASEFVGQLAGALRVAASDVKMQVEFNPKRVISWRQIGYAKHQLTKEQFRDNTVDAAEIGAAESGNALYVIETDPNGQGPVATVRARFRVPQTSDYREHEWVVPFGSAVELQQAAPSLRLAASASAFSEWLAASPFAGEVSTDRLLQILTGVPETYGADTRPKRLEWMIRQAKSISGK